MDYFKTSVTAFFSSLKKKINSVGLLHDCKWKSFSLVCCIFYRSNLLQKLHEVSAKSIPLNKMKLRITKSIFFIVSVAGCKGSVTFFQKLQCVA